MGAFHFLVLLWITERKTAFSNVSLIITWLFFRFNAAFSHQLYKGVRSCPCCCIISLYYIYHFFFYHISSLSCCNKKAIRVSNRVIYKLSNRLYSSIKFCAFFSFSLLCVFLLSAPTTLRGKHISIILEYILPSIISSYSCSMSLKFRFVVIMVGLAFKYLAFITL